MVKISSSNKSYHLSKTIHPKTWNLDKIRITIYLKVNGSSKYVVEKKPRAFTLNTSLEEKLPTEARTWERHVCVKCLYGRSHWSILNPWGRKGKDNIMWSFKQDTHYGWNATKLCFCIYTFMNRKSGTFMNQNSGKRLPNVPSLSSYQ